MDFKKASDTAVSILQKGAGNVSSYGVIGATKHKAIMKAICHRDMGQLSPHIEEKSYYYSAMNTAPSAADTQKLSLFGNWLLSDTGPWKKLMIDRERTVLELDGVVYGYLIEVDKNTDANLLANLSIAARIPKERPGNFDFFNHLVLEGVPPADAYFLCAYFHLTATGVGKGGFIGNGHSIFDYGNLWYDQRKTNVPTNFKRFSEGDPIIEEARPISRGGYLIGGVNKIFRNRKNNELEHIDSKVDVQGAIRGRWSEAFTGLSLRTIVDIWEGGYKAELLKVAA